MFIHCIFFVFVFCFILHPLIVSLTYPYTHAHIKRLVKQLVPGASPQDIQVLVLNSRSIKVEWLPPPTEKHHGQIIYYKIFYKPVIESDPSEALTLEKVFALDNHSQNLPYSTTINNLKKWTQYQVQLLAGTKIGDGPLSEPILVKTDEDGMTADDSFDSFIYTNILMHELIFLDFFLVDFIVLTLFTFF